MKYFQNVKGKFHVIADYSHVDSVWHRWLLRTFEMGKKRGHRGRRAGLNRYRGGLCAGRNADVALIYHEVFLHECFQRYILRSCQMKDAVELCDLE